ncbi:DUF2206 domain-containing protein [Methanobacterium sp. ACI-7]|uniref:DUF2206 domain-containing protein n=1 Tax=unclassified Methanobacterium TaxID=2627676 RepID=UPI0039C48D8F
MITENFIRINDWPIKNFIWFILFIQIGIWGLVGLEVIGINVSILREIVGFIYLVFVPGIILLRIFRLHKLSNIETLLYSVALSMSTLMFTGLIINFSLPLLGIEEPISFIPLMLSINIVTLVLLVLSYYIDKDFTQPNLKLKISSNHLFLIFPLFLSIFGTYLINYHNNNLGIIFMILTVAAIIFLVGFNKIDKSLYSFVIMILSISLLFHNSLISNYISGFDIQREIFLTKLVIYNFRWETFPNLLALTDLNSILSITILPSYFYYICNIDIVWIYKIMYPLIYALVPLGLYELFKREFNSKIAFFSVIYFIVSYSFFYNMMQLMRQLIAEIFLVAIILLLLDKKMDKKYRSILLIIFLFSLTMSHYGLAPIFLVVLIGTYLLQYLFNLYKKSKIDAVNPTIVLIFLTLLLIWYIYNNNSSVFISIIMIFDNIYSSLLSDFLGSDSTQALTIIGMKITFFNAITKYLYLLTQLLIVIGIMGFLFNIGNINKRFKMKKEYFFFAILFLGICILSIIVPNFSSQLDTVRMFHITIIVLSPFLVIGTILIVEKFNLLINHFKTYKIKAFNVISIVLIVFLFLNTGLVQEIAKEPYKPTMALSTNTNPPLFNENDILSAEWLNKYMHNESYIYSDINGFVLLGGFVGPKSSLLSYSLDTNRFNDLSNDSYILLGSSASKGTLNVVMDSINGSMEGFIDQKSFTPITRDKNRIYDNNITILF